MKSLMLFFVLCFSNLSIYSQSWTELGGVAPWFELHPNNTIQTICADLSGNIYAAGNFNDESGNYYVVKWDGRKWAELGGTVPGIALNAIGPIYSVISDAFGNIYAGGGLYDASGHVYVAKWDGNKWIELGNTGLYAAINTNSGVLSICSDSYGNIYAAGGIDEHLKSGFIGKWDGTNWTILGGTVPGIALNPNNGILSICSDALGNIYAGGYFTDSNGKNYVAKWDGTKWFELGGTTPGVALNANGYIQSISSDPAGNIYAGGYFTDEDGKYYVAKWNGEKWTELGGTAPGIALNDNGNGNINSICSDASGNTYSAGGFHDTLGYNCVAKWDGTKWTELGGTLGGFFGEPGTINAICSDSFGNIYAAGNFEDYYEQSYVAKFGTNPTVTNIIPEKVALDNISIYPNPTCNNISINVPEAGTVNIYNPLGELGATESIGSGNTNISLDGLGQGIYTVLFNTKGSKYYPPSKIIKE